MIKIPKTIKYWVKGGYRILMQATLHQLKVFEAVARHRSFTKAAEEMMITQPTVSTQVKQLTQTVGLPLFEQIGKQLYLTEAGESLLSTCQNIFEQLDNLEMQIAALKGTKQGRLRLGVVSTAKYFVPRLLGYFCQQYPGIDIALQVTNHATLIQRMQDNQDDLYILSQPPEDIALSTQPFLDNPLVVVARQDHPLVGEKNIPIKSLMGEPFIMREQGSGTRQAIQNLFDRYKIDVKVRLELGSNEAIKQGIAGGLGISVLSKHTLIAEQLMGELAILDVQHFPIHLRWYVTHLEGKQISIIAETFLKFLLENSNHVPTLETITLNQQRSANNGHENLVKMGAGINNLRI